jgi:hypothetical protein
VADKVNLAQMLLAMVVAVEVEEPVLLGVQETHHQQAHPRGIMVEPAAQGILIPVAGAVVVLEVPVLLEQILPLGMVALLLHPVLVEIRFLMLAVAAEVYLIQQLETV